MTLITSHPSRVRGLKFIITHSTCFALEESHPSRVRGLKFKVKFIDAHLNRVAPFTGAWIEIIHYATNGKGEVVAPFTGAWIEIDVVHPSEPKNCVAPFTGAWIEILRHYHTHHPQISRTLHGCVD